MLKQKFGKAPTYMRVNNGMELVNEEIITFCKAEGITIETTAPYSPSQNSVAKCFNRTLIELVRAMLIAKGLPTFLWDEAIFHVVYIWNQSPTRALKGKTPHEAWTRKKPDVSHFREFGSDVWILDESKNRSKLTPKSKKMVFVGFMEGPRAVRYWDKERRAIKVSRNFAFSENEELEELQVMEVPGLEAEGENPQVSASKITPDTTGKTQETSAGFIHDNLNQTNEQNSWNLHARSTKIDYRQMNDPLRKLITRKALDTPKINESPNDSASLAIKQIILEKEFGFLVKEDCPKTVKEALDSEEGEHWKKAMEEEVENLKEIKTWTLKDLPEDRKAIGCKWVFVRKRNEMGDIIQWKARIVAQGFSQKPGTDYNNDGTFAPVM